MYVGMLLHVGLLVEPLAAVLAGVGPRVRVDQEVSGQRARPLEALPALLALRTTHHRVIISYNYNPLIKPYLLDTRRLPLFDDNNP